MARRKMPEKVEEVFEPVVQEPKSDEPVQLIVANCRHLNLRAKPSTDSKIVDVLDYGTPVQVDDIDGDWFLVTVKKKGENIHKYGYILAEFTAEE